MEILKFLKIKDAATYCGYHPKYFSKIRKLYQIPLYGPYQNKVKTTDLDLWMEDHDFFIKVNGKRLRTLTIVS